MYIKEKYDSLGQRVAAYYLMVLKPLFAPVEGAYLSCHMEIHDFLKSFYLLLYEHPEALGFPKKQDTCMELCFTPEAKKNYIKDLDRIYHTINDFLRFLYRAGYLGKLFGNTLYLNRQLLEEFLRSDKRRKRILLSMLSSSLGFDIRIMEREVEISNRYAPKMIEGLSILATLCHEHQGDKGFSDFYRCDWEVMDKGYTPNFVYVLDRLIDYDPVYRNVKRLVRYMKALGYSFQCEQKDCFQFVVHCYHYKIKRTPLLTAIFDIRFKAMLRFSLMFVSTNRLVPFLSDAPPFIVKNFYEASCPCRGETCMRHVYMKGDLSPSVLKTGFGEKTICWRLNISYDILNETVLRLIIHYLALHQRLIQPEGKAVEIPDGHSVEW
jgi:hypothetical protein